MALELTLMKFLPLPALQQRILQGLIEKLMQFQRRECVRKEVEEARILMESEK